MPMPGHGWPAPAGNDVRSERSRSGLAGRRSQHERAAGRGERINGSQARFTPRNAQRICWAEPVGYGAPRLAPFWTHSVVFRPRTGGNGRTTVQSRKETGSQRRSLTKHNETANATRGSRAGGPAVEILKVSSKSNPNSVAGAMAGVVRQAGAVEVQVVGAGALNQAIKAVAIARNYVASAGLDLVCSPTFADISIDAQDRTGIH